jgi:diguanylate cyclase (GGDEF)-like protein/PAS domain S-box-containing protein
VDLSQLGLLANAVAAIALTIVAVSILVSVARTGHWRRNRLDLGAALIFLSCGLGHAVNPRRGEGDWQLVLLDGLTAIVAVTYLRVRRAAGAEEGGGVLYEDVRRRQHELAGQVMAANVREELATERAAAADHRLSRVFASAPIGMAVLDRHGRTTRANPSLGRILARDLGARDEVQLVDLLAPTDRELLETLVRQAADGAEAIEVQIERPDGTLVWGRVTVTPLTDDDGSLLVQIEDVTERRRAEERLQHLAMHDPLTGLPNRLLFHSRATAALRHATHTGCYVGCLFVDLDHFKVVNDSLGHTAGDRVLTSMADRLAVVVRPEDTVARMGGDEFCLLLVGLEHQGEAALVAERVCRALSGFVELDGVQVTTSASVGVAVALPGDRSTSETLVRDADTALFRAKAKARGCAVVFDAEMREEAQRRLQLENELRLALPAGQLRVVYQPQWSLRTERLVGVEALVRWAHPTQGELLPEQFLPVAVECGLVVEIGRRVLAQAVRSMAGWLAADPDLRLAVNVTARQMASAGLADEVSALLAEVEVPTTALCLELSESDLTTLGPTGTAALIDLHDRGIRLAVDDLGTGESSLTHLVTLPVDGIKIDRSFVEHVHVPGAKRAVVQALLSLGTTIGLDVVAEGPETDEHIEALRQLGCDVVQGFVTGRPLTEDEVTALLDAPVAVGAH